MNKNVFASQHNVHELRRLFEIHDCSVRSAQPRPIHGFCRLTANYQQHSNKGQYNQKTLHGKPPVAINA
jgi:hypothetical protein